MKRLLFILTVITLLAASPYLALAQTEPPGTPPAEPAPEEGAIPKVHVVQEGETLFSIATTYGTTVEALQLVNNLSDADFIYVGQELLIPGAVGEVVAAIYTVQIGDTLAGIAQAFGTTAAEVAADNRLMNPAGIAAGQSLSIISRNGSAEARPPAGTPYVVQPGDTLLSVAMRHRVDPAELAAVNDLAYPARLFAGMRLRLPGEGVYQALPGDWRTVRARPGPYGPGDTISLYVETLDDSLPAGTFLDQTLHFAPYQDGFVALVGVDGFTRPGRHLLTLNTTADPAGGSFSQQVEILSGGFLTQTITVPDTLSYLLAPEVRATEDAFLATFFNQFTETAYWEGIFQRPVSTTLITASYGGARSYNGGPYDIYHTGIDFGGGIGTPIMAPANGVVLFAGPLELRGLSIILDHGLGVMTGYYHLEQMMVAVGDVVPAGQVIGLGGSTGLSTGPHLHWDLRVHNVPVDGQKWLATQFP